MKNSEFCKLSLEDHHWSGAELSYTVRHSHLGYLRPCHKTNKRKQWHPKLTYCSPDPPNCTQTALWHLHFTNRKTGPKRLSSLPKVTKLVLAIALTGH